MALGIAGELSVDASNTVLTFTDTTGVYNSVSNPSGYGAPNKATADNVFTRYSFTFQDYNTTNVDTDGSTLPTTDFIPLNGLTRDFTLSQMGLTELTAGVVQINYKPYFNTASGGDVIFTNGTNVVIRNSGQTLTTDLADTYMVLWQGVEYTIVEGSITASQFLITETYEGATDSDTLYAGYSTTVAVLITKPWNDCFDPQWAELDHPAGCDMSDEELRLFHLYCIYLSVLAKFTDLDYSGANDLMIDLLVLCNCVENGGGCC